MQVEEKQGVKRRRSPEVDPLYGYFQTMDHGQKASVRSRRIEYACITPFCDGNATYAQLCLACYYATYRLRKRGQPCSTPDCKRRVAYANRCRACNNMRSDRRKITPKKARGPICTTEPPLERLCLSDVHSPLDHSQWGSEKPDGPELRDQL